MELFEVLKLKNGEMVAFVGAGGKTSLMRRLASECVRKGIRVLITTSTKMFISQMEGCGRLILERDVEKLLQKLRSTLDASPIIAAASDLAAENDLKVVGFCSQTLDEIHMTGIFDVILLEADGSRGLPLKAPKEYEPVLPLSSNRVFCVTGVDVLNCKLNEKYVHRPRLVARLAGQQVGSLVTGETITHVVRRYACIVKQLSPGATFIPVLNKVAGERHLEEVREAASLLLKEYEMVLLTDATLPDAVKEVLV